MFEQDATVVFAAIAETTAEKLRAEHWIGRGNGTVDAVAKIIRDAYDEQEVKLETLRRKADRLAYHCANAVARRVVGSRSAIGDALLDYLEVGGMDGPKTVPEWVEKHEATGR